MSTPSGQRGSTGLNGTPSDGLPHPRRWFAVLALSLGVALSVLVNSVVNVALPTMRDDLGIATAGAVWIVSAYQLAVAVALLPMAAWGERTGHLRVYQFGMLAFTLASLGCAVAPSFETLLTARVLQGLGAAGIMAVNTALLRVVYPRAQLGRGLGLNGMVVAVSAALGPTLGGGVLALASWPWIFALLTGLAGFALALGWRVLLDPPRIPRTAGFDAAGVLLQAFAIVALMLGLGSLGSLGSLGHGASVSWSAAALVALAFLVGTVFVRRELRLDSPLLPLDLLRQPLFALSFGASFCSFVAQMLALVALPFFLHQSGFAPEQIGLLMTPWPLAVMLVAPLAGALSDRFSASLMGGLGLSLASLALALLALLPVQDVGAFSLVWRVALCGVGFALFSAPNVRALVAAAPVPRSAAVGAMIAISRQTGQTLGASLAGALLGASNAAAGPQCFAVAAVVTGIAAVVGFLRLYRGHPTL